MELTRLITTASCPIVVAYYVKHLIELQSLINENIAQVRQENDVLTLLSDIKLQDIKNQTNRLLNQLFLRNIKCA